MLFLGGINPREFQRPESTEKPCPFVWWRTISLENQEESWFPPAISEERWGATTELLLNIQPLKKFANYNSILELFGKILWSWENPPNPAPRFNTPKNRFW